MAAVGSLKSESFMLKKKSKSLQPGMEDWFGLINMLMTSEQQLSFYVTSFNNAWKFCPFEWQLPPRCVTN